MSDNGGPRHQADEPTSFVLRPPHPQPRVPHPQNPYAAPAAPGTPAAGAA
ncbi:hypothetical protein [Streptomyces mexicanus]|nr:hypothetical protein [Streptomyces mexicanus]